MIKPINVPKVIFLRHYITHTLYHKINIQYEDQNNLQLMNARNEIIMMEV